VGLRLFDIIKTFLVRSWPLSVSRVKIKYLFYLICSTASWPSTADTWSHVTSKCSGRSSASTSSKERASPSTASTRPSSRGHGRERERLWEEERDPLTITGYFTSFWLFCQFNSIVTKLNILKTKRYLEWNFLGKRFHPPYMFSYYCLHKIS